MKQIPNILSFFRILLIPVVVWQMATGNMFTAGLLLVLSFFTDFLDGWLARHFNWVTDLGKVLDPAADKLTQVAVSITLIIVMREYWWLFAFLIFKDAVMGLLALWVIGRGVTMDGARWTGKVATFMYYFTVVVIALFPQAPRRITIPLLILVGVTALIAGLSYIPSFRNYRREAVANKKAKQLENTGTE